MPVRFWSTIFPQKNISDFTAILIHEAYIGSFFFEVANGSSKMLAILQGHANVAQEHILIKQVGFKRSFGSSRSEPIMHLVKKIKS